MANPNDNWTRVREANRGVFQFATADLASAAPTSGTTVLAFHEQGAGWTHTCASGADQANNAFDAVLSAVCPSQGNLFVTMTGTGILVHKAIPPSLSVLIGWNLGFEVDGADSNFNTSLNQERVVTAANEEIRRSPSASCVIAVPAAATVVIKANWTLDGDVALVGNFNFTTLEVWSVIHALFVPGTAISDTPGDFT